MKSTNMMSTFLSAVEIEASLGAMNFRMVLLLVLAVSVFHHWVPVLPAIAADVWAVWYFSGLLWSIAGWEGPWLGFVPGQTVQVASNGSHVSVQLNSETSLTIPIGRSCGSDDH